MGRRKLSHMSRKKKKVTEAMDESDSDESKNGGLTYAQAQKMVEITYQDKDYYVNMFDDLEIRASTDDDDDEAAENLFTARANTVKLPDANIQVIVGDKYPWWPNEATKTPHNRIKYIEKSQEDLDEDIEYDIDEEDIEWLKLVNKERTKEALKEVSKEQFIYIMDRLEKDSYFELDSKQSLHSSDSANEEDDAICCICLDGECVNSNVILFCDMCNLAVHQECYGVPYIPEGQWLCRKCIQSPSNAVSCALCPNKYGAFKQTDDNKWAHMICAIWIPEVHFANTVFLEPIIGIENIESARRKLMCYICRKRNEGACIQCDKTNCYTAFHVTCAQQAGLYMNIQDPNLDSSDSSSIKKAAYCDVHTPAGILSANQRSGNHKNLEEMIRREQAKRAKKAKKILTERQAPILMPKLTDNAKSSLLQSLNLDKKERFLDFCINFWLLKRKLRAGVPLIRRLQSAMSMKMCSTSSNNKMKDKQQTDEKLKQELKEQLFYWKKLRQDLERARLLMELIRKRERTKRDYIRMHETVTNYQLKPFQLFLLHILDKLREFDKARIFHEPVKGVVGYYDYIKEPMDFSKMQVNIEKFKYSSFKQFEADFSLIISNCLSFNKDNQYYYKAALRLKEQGMALFKRANRVYESVGYDEAGLHLERQSNETSNIMCDSTCNTNNILNESSSNSSEIDSILNSQISDDIPLENKLKILLDRLDLANTLKNSGARTKWARHLKEEISVIRRKISSKMNTSRQLRETNYHSPMKILNK